MTNLFQRIERKNISIWDFAIAVFVISLLRNIAENTLKFEKLLNFQSDTFLALKIYFLHYNFFWFTVFVVLSTVIYFFTFKKNTVLNAFKIGLFAMPLILFPPLYDFIIGNSEYIGYPNNPVDVIKSIPNFLNPTYKIYGITIGMRFEILIACVLSGYYIFYKTRKYLLSVIGGLTIFIIILLLGLWVSFFGQLFEYGFHFSAEFTLSDSILYQTGEILARSTQKISIVYVLLTFVFICLAYFLHDKKKFLSVTSNFRFTRAVHYLMLFMAGFIFVFGIHQTTNETVEYAHSLPLLHNPFDYVGIILGLVSIFLSFQSAVVFNDIYDYQIDKVSNHNRPLVRKTISVEEYKTIGQIFILFALVFSFCINEAFFVFVLAYNALAYLYSNPPFRLRKYFIASNLVLAVIALITFHAGASLYVFEYSFHDIPIQLSIVLLFGYFFATNIKDIKDYEGDTLANVQTFLTIFGKSTGTILIALFITATIIFIPYFLAIKGMLLLSLLISIAFNIMLFTLKKYKETLIFAIYYLYMFILFYNLILNYS